MSRGWAFNISAIVCGILLGLACSGAIVAIQKLYEPPLMPHAAAQEGAMNDQAGRQIARLEKPAPSADEIAFLSGPKCGQCIHWHQEPRQQVHVNEAAIAHLPPTDQKRVHEAARLQNSGSLLNEERRGECRRELLTLPQMQQTPNGPQFAGSISYYPSGIEAGFRACGHFAPRLPLPIPDDF